MEDTRELVRSLYKITAALKKLHPHRNFTPDGILVGSLGEVLAEYHYDLKPLDTGAHAHDCIKDGLKIQVKTTQRESIQLGHDCDYLIALKLHQDGTAEEIYNGPGSPVWDLVKDKPLPRNGLYSIRLNTLRTMMKSGVIVKKFPRIRD